MMHPQVSPSRRHRCQPGLVGTSSDDSSARLAGRARCSVSLAVIDVAGVVDVPVLYQGLRSMVRAVVDWL